MGNRTDTTQIAQAMPNSDNYLGMAVYLIIASLVNAAFVIRAVRDAFFTSNLNKSPAAVLLAISVAELTWALPCAVQCTITTVAGVDGAWAPSYGGWGCDFMGFYSQFGSVSGMLSTFAAAWVTARLSQGKLPASIKVATVSVCVFGVSILISLLPLIGVGHYAFWDGFCYIDWYNTAQNLVMLTVLLISFGGTLGFLIAAAKAGWPRVETAIMALAFISAWFLWIPASPIGLADEPFPKNYMIIGAIMGHAQAIVNPYVYGIRWRRAIINSSSSGAVAPAAADKNSNYGKAPDTP